MKKTKAEFIFCLSCQNRPLRRVAEFYCLSLILLFAPFLVWAQTGDSSLRLENEDKLAIPEAKSGEVWQYLEANFLEDSEYLSSFGRELSADLADEGFVDFYFDTPRLNLYQSKNGLRQRRRFDWPAGEEVSELVQIKISNVENQALSRGELKFAISRPVSFFDIEDKHPLYGLVAAPDRQAIKDALASLNVNSKTIRPILKQEQRRRRIGVSDSAGALMTLSFDQVKARRWWARADYTELEIELNEIRYTSAGAEEKEKMRAARDAIANNILEQFDFIVRDLAPKYNKTLDGLGRDIPFMKFFIRIGIL